MGVWWPDIEDLQTRDAEDERHGPLFYLGLALVFGIVAAFLLYSLHARADNVTVAVCDPQGVCVIDRSVLQKIIRAAERCAAQGV